MPHKKYLIYSVVVIGILLVLFSTYIFDNNQLKSSFAVEDTKPISDKDIREFISQGNYYRDILQDKNKAIGWYDKALAIDPYNAIALAEKGVALSNLYNFSGATELIDKAIEISPNEDVTISSKGKVFS